MFPSLDKRKIVAWEILQYFKKSIGVQFVHEIYKKIKFKLQFILWSNFQYTSVKP